MKLILILITGLMTINAFGQINNLKVPDVRDRGINKPVPMDTLLRVSYVDKNIMEKPPAYYLNDQFVSGSIIKTLDPKRIENIRVEKLDVEVAGIKYYGQILIKHVS